MKFEQILEINKNLITIKNLNKKFKFDFGKILLNNLNLTNKLVNIQNKKLNDLTLKYSIYDGYDYVINEENIDKYNIEYKKLYEEDININSIRLHLINKDDLKNVDFDITTVELLMPLLDLSE